METQFIRAVFDLDCDWEGLPPVYRIYVRDQLFAEREWRWTDSYLEEILQIQAMPGIYDVRLETVDPNLAHFRAYNHRVEYGPACWTDNQTLEILDPFPDSMKFLYFFIALSYEEQILTRGIKPIDLASLYSDASGRFILLADDAETAKQYYQQATVSDQNTDLLMIALDIKKLDQNLLCLDGRSNLSDKTKFWQYQGFIKPVMIASRKRCQINNVILP